MGEMCTQFTFEDPDDHRPCRCPRCQGFLPAHFPLDRQFLCRKCGAVLKTYPSLEEYMSWDQFLFDVQEDRWGGRICIVPELAVKISTVLPPRIPKRRRKKMEKWAHGGGLFGPQEPGSYIGFTRRVWVDKEGEFIEVDGERLEIADARIHMVVGE
ncbi:MAG: hypothetical protein KAX31_05400 [Thermoplasmata archaeon]|nr:hypothetical protein [Thermoplasmata archaeon]